jgi:hypothetical protein
MDRVDHGGFVTHVAAIGERWNAVGAQIFESRCIFLVVATPDGDAATRGGNTFGHAETDPAVAAGNDECLAAEIGHLVLLLFIGLLGYW